jgi:GTP pyrophosphokinase
MAPQVENRESFFKRLVPYHPPMQLMDVQLAYSLAKFGHRSQKRKELDDDNNPIRYFEHVRRVALILIDEAKILDPNMIIASLLHDAVEDTRDVTPELIERCFGSDVAMMVKLLSKVSKEGYLERIAIMNDWRIYAIKTCDRLDNVRSLHLTNPEFIKKQVYETIEKYYPFMDRMIKIAPIQFQPNLSNLRDAVYVEIENLCQA